MTYWKYFKASNYRQCEEMWFTCDLWQNQLFTFYALKGSKDKPLEDAICAIMENPEIPLQTVTYFAEGFGYT